MIELKIPYYIMKLKDGEFSYYPSENKYDVLCLKEKKNYYFKSSVDSLEVLLTDIPSAKLINKPI